VEAPGGHSPLTDTFVSVHIGESRKQTRFTGVRKFRLPDGPAKQTQCEIDVFKRLGCVSFFLSSCARGNALVVVPCDLPGFASLSLLISSNAAEAPIQDKVGGKRLGGAQEYLTEHRIEEHLVAALRDVIKTKPEDPHKLLSGGFLKSSSTPTLPPLHPPVTPRRAAADDMGVLQSMQAMQSKASERLLAMQGPLELQVETADGLAPPADTWIALRIGDTRKQARFTGSRVYRFPESVHRHAVCQLEVYLRLGSAAPMLDGSGFTDISIKSVHPNVPPMPLRMSLQRYTGDSGEEVVDKQTKIQMRLQEARQYMQKHRIEENLGNVIREVVRAKPENPTEFLSGCIEKQGKWLPPLSEGLYPSSPSASGRLQPWSSDLSRTLPSKKKTVSFANDVLFSESSRSPSKSRRRLGKGKTQGDTPSTEPEPAPALPGSIPEAEVEAAAAAAAAPSPAPSAEQEVEVKETPLRKFRLRPSVGSWMQPAPVVPHDDVAPPRPVPQEATRDPGGHEDALPEGWEEMHDAATGGKYYRNRAGGESVWVGFPKFARRPSVGSWRQPAPTRAVEEVHVALVQQPASVQTVADVIFPMPLRPSVGTWLMRRPAVEELPAVEQNDVVELDDDFALESCADAVLDLESSFRDLEASMDDQNELLQQQSELDSDCTPAMEVETSRLRVSPGDTLDLMELLGTFSQTSSATNSRPQSAVRSVSRSRPQSANLLHRVVEAEEALAGAAAEYDQVRQLSDHVKVAFEELTRTQDHVSSLQHKLLEARAQAESAQTQAVTLQRSMEAALADLALGFSQNDPVEFRKTIENMALLLAAQAPQSPQSKSLRSALASGALQMPPPAPEMLDGSDATFRASTVSFQADAGATFRTTASTFLNTARATNITTAGSFFGDTQYSGFKMMPSVGSWYHRLPQINEGDDARPRTSPTEPGAGQAQQTDAAAFATTLPAGRDGQLWVKHGGSAASAKGKEGFEEAAADTAVEAEVEHASMASRRSGGEQQETERREALIAEAEGAEEVEDEFPEHAVPLLEDDPAGFQPPTTWCRCERLRSPEVMDICRGCTGWVAPVRFGSMVVPNFDNSPSGPSPIVSRDPSAGGLSPFRARGIRVRPSRPKRMERSGTPPADDRDGQALRSMARQETGLSSMDAGLGSLDERGGSPNGAAAPI